MQEEAQAAGEWFIRRFIHSLPGRNFALAMLEGKPVKSRIRGYNARYDIVFSLWEPGEVLVVPLTAEAQWAKGTIRTGEKYQFFSEPEPCSES